MPYLSENLMKFQPDQSSVILWPAPQKDITKVVRNMFGENLHLYEHENQVLAEFREFVNSKNLQIPSCYSDRYILRWAQFYRGNCKKTYDFMMKHYDWKMTAFPIPLDYYQNQVNAGVLYIYKRDKQ